MDERPSISDRRAASRDRRHQRILAAAEQLFAAQGFAKTTMDEIAGTAGVSKGLLYQHYESKEALLLAVWLRLVEAWNAASGSAGLVNGSVAESIGESLRLSFEHVCATPSLRRILAQDPGRLTPHGVDGIAGFARHYRARLEKVLAGGVRSGQLRADLDIPHTAELIWLLHHALTRELCVGPQADERGDTDAFVRSAVAFIVAGLREPGSGIAQPSR